MSIAVPLYGFGTGGNNQVLINVVGGLTQPENPKYGTIWIRTSTPINVWEVFPVTPVWDAGEGHVYIQNVPATDGNPPNFTALDYSRKPYGAIWLRLSGAMQRVNGAWVRQDAWVWRDNVWTQFSATRNTPEFTYTGDYAIVDDSDKAISDFATWTGNWKIRFLTSGTLTFTNLNGAGNGIDVFLVGGGGGGGSSGTYGGGGGGGYTKTIKAVAVHANTTYTIVVGAGGEKESPGGESSIFGASASGGKPGAGYGSNDGKGGDGGSGGGAYGSNGARYGGTDGSDGEGPDNSRGKGQGSTTREFGESSGRLYSGGGSSGQLTSVGASKPPIDETAGAPKTSPPANRGGGGGGTDHVNASTGTAGGSGIVIIRNKR